MASKARPTKYSAADNERRHAAILDMAAEQRVERSRAATEKALDTLEQGYLRARWLAVKARALQTLHETDPRIKRARELRARAEAILKRTAQVSIATKTLAAEKRWIANEISRHRREKR